MKLEHQFLFRRRRLGRFEEDNIHSMAREFLDQQHLVCIFATQSIWRIDQQGFYLPFGYKITQSFQTGSNKHCPTVALILEDPFFRNGVAFIPGVLGEGCDLAQYCMFHFLPF
ncbi:MAG: hypothetical protein WB763_01225 [Terriglobia bacterium]